MSGSGLPSRQVFLKEFLTNFDILARVYDGYQVFTDLCQAGICCHHSKLIATGGIVKDKVNSKIFVEVKSRYQDDDFARVIGLIILLKRFAVCFPFDDLLGEAFMHLFGDRAKKGQFFTPKEVCMVLAKSLVLPETKKTKFIEPCCGSGRMILQVASYAPDNYFFGNDIDKVCAMMTVLNVYFNGFAAEIAWGDSIRLDFKQVWQINAFKPGILPLNPQDSIGYNY